MSFQNFVQWFLPKEDKFFVLLEKQSNVLLKAATTLAAFSDTSVVMEELSKSVQDIEHEGDELVQELEQELALTFITKIDREDIHALSTEIDDVIDLCNSAARSCVLYDVKAPTESMIGLVRVLVECATELQSSLPNLRAQDYIKFLDTKRKVKKLEKEADVIYRNAVSALFHIDNLDYKIFVSQKSVLEKLESAVDACNAISCVLATLAIKHA